MSAGITKHCALYENLNIEKNKFDAKHFAQSGPRKPSADENSVCAKPVFFFKSSWLLPTFFFLCAPRLTTFCLSHLPSSAKAL